MPYRQLVTELCDFLEGDTEPIVKRLDAEMREAATALEFEKAARLRDRLLTVRRAIERQQMVADTSEDIDVIGIAGDELEASVQVFYVRKGRVVGRKGMVVDKVEELTEGGLVSRILENLYGEDPPQGVPKLVLVPGRARRHRDVRGVARAASWVAGRGAGAAAGGQAGLARDGHAQRRGGVHPPPAAAGERPQHAQPGADRAAGSGSTCPRRRCGSSATTWPICRAPTTSARWSCSRTGCRTSGSTAASRCTSPATTTTRRWRRCSPAG